MRQVDFRDTSGNDPYRQDATAVNKALAAMKASLLTGALKKKSARTDAALVRRELDAAFRLDPRARDAMTGVFGADGAKTFKDGAASTDVIRSASDIPTIVPHVDGTSEVLTLKDAIGSGSSSAESRRGDFAWQRAPFTVTRPDAVRAYFRRIQRALNAGVPVPTSWFYPSNLKAAPGAVREVPAVPGDPEESVDHETLIVDYEVENVPGFGRLAAGSAATKAQKEAALADEARVVFFRVVDSYGVETKRTPTDIMDLYVEYLLGTAKTCPKGVAPTSSRCEEHQVLEDVILPRGF